MKKESKKKILLSAIAFSVYAFVTLNYVHATSLFLTDIGPESLPYVYIVAALVVLLNSIFTSAYSSKFSSDKIMVGLLGFFILNFLVLAFIPSGTYVHAFYFMATVIFLMNLEEVVLNHYANSMLTPLQAKSLMPTIYGFMSLGVVLAALVVVPYQELHEATRIGVIPIISLVFILGLVMFTSKVFKRDITASFASTREEGGKSNLKQSFKFVFKQSSLFRSLAIVVFFVVGLHLLMEFKLKTVLADNFGHEQLTEILGLVYMANRVIIWALSTFAVKRMLFRFGVSNLLLFYPISMVVMTLVAIALGLNYLAVIGLYFVYSASHFTSFGICTSQILSIVPKRIHESVFFLVRGLLYAVSMLIFSFVLLIYTYDIGLEATLNTGLIVLISFALIFLVLKVKALYSDELKSNLFKKDEYLKLRSIDLLAEKVSKDKGERYLRRLLGMPNITNNVRGRVLMSVGIIGNYQTIVDLAKILLATDSVKLKSQVIHAINMIIKNQKDLNKYPVTKHFLLKVYESVLLSDSPLYVKTEIIHGLQYFNLEDVIEYLEQHLKSDSIHIKINAIKTLATFDDRGITPYIDPYLESNNLSLLRAAIVSLWNFEELRVHLIPKIAKMLSMKTDSAVKNSLYVIGAINAEWEKNYVLAQLEHKKPHIRTHALLALIKLGETNRLEDLAQKMLTLAKNNDSKEIEFILSHYRYFDEAVKKSLISKIQQMKERDSLYFYNAFRDSKYVFGWEEGELSRSVV